MENSILTKTLFKLRLIGEQRKVNRPCFKDLETRLHISISIQLRSNPKQFIIIELITTSLRYARLYY